MTREEAERRAAEQSARWGVPFVAARITGTTDYIAQRRTHVGTVTGAQRRGGRWRRTVAE